MNKLKISLLQTDLAWENPGRNIEVLERQILEADNTDIFVLPEMFTTGFTNNTDCCNENHNNLIISWMTKIASITKAAICGSVIFFENNKIYNRFIFAKPDGEINYYNKRHLFGFGGENGIFSQGDKRVIVEYKSFKILLQICYDLRFPVWSRNIDNYDLIIYTANWPSARRVAWDVLLKARAIENQCFVIGVNRIGIDGNNIKYNGGSCVVNYLGDYAIKAQDDLDQVVLAEVDKKDLYNYRNFFPALKDMDKFNIVL